MAFSSKARDIWMRKKKGRVQGHVRTLGHHQWGSGPMGAMVKNSDHLEATGQWEMMQKEVSVHKIPVHLVMDTETNRRQNVYLVISCMHGSDFSTTPELLASRIQYIWTLREPTLGSESWILVVLL